MRQFLDRLAIVILLIFMVGVAVAFLVGVIGLWFTSPWLCIGVFLAGSGVWAVWWFTENDLDWPWQK